MKIKKIVYYLAMVMGVAWNGVLMADSTATMATTKTAPATTSVSTTKAAPPETPEDKAYREQMIALSNAISAKITQIQAKQKELDQEVYLTAKPTVQGELDALNKELDGLELQKKQLEAQKTVRDLSKQNSSANH